MVKLKKVQVVQVIHNTQKYQKMDKNFINGLMIIEHIHSLEHQELLTILQETLLSLQVKMSLVH